MNNDELTYLLNKIIWPQPARDLAWRIEHAAMAASYAPAFDGHRDRWGFKSPALACVAVILALVLGMASGGMTGRTASANDGQTHPYGTTPAISVMKLYAGQE